MFEQSVSIYTAFLAGLLSFFSPCILPLLPAYFTFITGVSLDELLNKSKNFSVRRQIIISTLLFILGFSTVFIIMGFSASVLGSFFMRHKGIFRIVGGIVICILGLQLSGLVRITFLQLDKRFHLKKRPLHWAGAFFAGNAFAAGWTPCIGPILGSILVLAGGQETMTQGGYLLMVYSLGLAIPFFILSFFIHLLIRFMKKAGKYIRYMNRIAGALLIFIGILLIFGRFDSLMTFFM